MEKAMYVLDQKDMPTKWYNIQPDLPKPMLPPLHPGTRKPVTGADLAPLFPMALIMQEVSQERYIEIPEEIQAIYKQWRPTALHRAFRLEKALDTPAKIYYKYEGTSPAGSHKLNTAVAQAYYNKKEGVKSIATETGAGQWGSALAMGCKYFDIELKVFMVKASFQSKPYRRVLMETWGGKVTPSPSTETKAGRDMLAKDPECPGSLGIAISEAVEYAVTHGAKYALGSVLNHVLLHQTIVGEETKLMMEKLGIYPDIIVGCIGGGSNFAGMILPFLKDKISGKKKNLRVIAVEPQAAPSLTRGKYAYDFGDEAGMAPLIKMYTLGHDFVPSPIHAGGLRYHGKAPILSHLYDLKLVEARAEYQIPVFEAAVKFARTEGIVSAPESSHAIKVAIDEAIACKQSGQSKVILIAHSGHGHFDLAAYDEYLSGRMKDYELTQAELDKSLASIPQI